MPHSMPAVTAASPPPPLPYTSHAASRVPRVAQDFSVFSHYPNADLVGAAFYAETQQRRLRLCGHPAALNDF